MTDDRLIRRLSKHNDGFLRVFIILCLVVVLAGCGELGKVSTPELPDKSMKGYELYSWQEGGEWYFALLVGTNRLKTHQEVTSLESRLAGWEELESHLGRLAKGEQVFWIVERVPGMSLPPEQVVEKARVYFEKRGIQLDIVD